jgi:Cu(I)/Ag(I) efflux system membrane fusion protein
VIDNGTSKVVYVESIPGRFEGRAVVLGPRSGDRYMVLDGLAAGERVAAAGAFLIDAESRLHGTTRDEEVPRHEVSDRSLLTPRRPDRTANHPGP